MKRHTSIHHIRTDGPEPHLPHLPEEVVRRLPLRPLLRRMIRTVLVLRSLHLDLRGGGLNRILDVDVPVLSDLLQEVDLALAEALMSALLGRLLAQEVEGQLVGVGLGSLHDE